MTTNRFQYKEIGIFDSKKAVIALLELDDEIRAEEKLQLNKKNQGKIK
ncbi:hypothetical protein NST55_28670 [Bacillus sp. FSL R10-2789]